MAKALYLSSQNTVDCYKSFCSVSKFLITNTTFFSIMKYLFHHTFNFYITYLALVHNYNTIKYICFISLWAAAGKSSRARVCVCDVCVCGEGRKGMTEIRLIGKLLAQFFLRCVRGMVRKIRE